MTLTSSIPRNYMLGLQSQKYELAHFFIIAESCMYT